MGELTQLSERLMVALKLTATPVAVTFSHDAPASGPEPSLMVPAGCKFWELGAKERLVTRAAHHQLCSIGVHTHNFDDAPAKQSGELEATLATMQGLDYARLEEVRSLPVMETPSRFVVYAPLAEAVDTPAAVLLFADAGQGLIITEALTRVDGDSPLALGRPACALIPQVVNSGRSASSLGCCGARAYLDTFDDSTTLWALPGVNLEDYVEAVETFATANSLLRRFHDQRRMDVAAGKMPSVEESLERLE